MYEMEGALLWPRRTEAASCPASPALRAARQGQAPVRYTGFPVRPHRRSDPSPHVMAYWDALEWSLSHGLAYDMDGAPTSGSAKFKIAMGGQAELSTTAERTRLRAWAVHIPGGAWWYKQELPLKNYRRV